MDLDEYLHFLATLFHRCTKKRFWLGRGGRLRSKYVWVTAVDQVKPADLFKRIPTGLHGGHP